MSFTSDTLSRIERLNYILGGIAIAAAAVLLSQAQAVGITVGVVLSSANFAFLRRIADRALRGSPAAQRAATMFFIPKLAGLMGIVALALWFLPMSPLAFAAGFSVFLVSIAIEAVRVVTTPVDPGDGPTD
ncbi:MAG TPA: ATP synthase subunit I [Kofleriaceae bacterium]|nr:ATP synthase subunit I [Kofleriaceae bacterium]